MDRIEPPHFEESLQCVAVYSCHNGMSMAERLAQRYESLDSLRALLRQTVKAMYLGSHRDASRALIYVS